MKFKSFYIEEIKKLLLEGGVSKHMSHPYDVLSVEDFLDFYEKLFTGGLDTVEKVDGVNILGLFNDNGKLTFARNATEAPSTNIESKFPETHPGGDAFRAGFKALQTALQKLSMKDRIKYQLVNEDGTKKNSINMEIMFGSIPNIIQYHDTDNFIVFHNYMGNNDEGYVPKTNPIHPKLLNELAKQIGSVKIKSNVVSYFGEPGKTKKIVKNETSNWVFKGPIGVPKEKISSQLRNLSKKFKSFPEVKKLKDWENLPKDKLFDIMKSLTRKVGAEVLMSVESQLFSGIRKTPEGYPKIEGLVVKFKNNLIKITGDFAQLNQDLWRPLKDGLDKPLKELNRFIMDKMLDVPKIASIDKRTWKKIGMNAEEYLLKKNKKFYSDPKNLTSKVNTTILKKEIDKTFVKLKKLYIQQTKTKNVKKDDILRAIRIGAFQVQELKEKLKLVKNRPDLVKVFAQSMFALPTN